MPDDTFYLKFVDQLERLKTDRAAMATLRRGLAFDLGTHIASYSYIEPFANNINTWQRKMCYLVAGLYASHPRHTTTDYSFGTAMQQLKTRREKQRETERKSSSLEQRFITLLDADDEQLANRLRQMVALMRSEDIAINYAKLLSDLRYWGSTRRLTQQRWAQDFYRTQATSETDNAALTETSDKERV